MKVSRGGVLRLRKPLGQRHRGLQRREGSGCVCAETCACVCVWCVCVNGGKAGWADGARSRRALDFKLWNLIFADSGKS